MNYETKYKESKKQYLQMKKGGTSTNYSLLETELNSIRKSINEFIDKCKDYKRHQYD